MTERLRRSGIEVAIGHGPPTWATADLVTVSTAVRPDNPEVVEARPAGPRRCCPGPRRWPPSPRCRRCIAVAGTHGKTTTASMLALILVEAGLRPSFLIGGDVNEIGTNAVWDAGEWIVVEADESDGTFLAPGARHRRGHQRRGRPPRPLRVLRRRARRPSPSSWPSARHRGWSGGDDPEAAGHRPGRRGRPRRARRRRHLHHGRRWRRAGARWPSTWSDPTGPLVAHLAVPVPGLHNAKNAAVAAVAALGRRRPRRGRGPGPGPLRRAWPAGSSSGASCDGVTFVDDYAHLPTEVRAALAAARNGGWGRVVAVFQPHRYSRTAELGPSSAGPSPTPTWWSSPTSTAPARRRCPGCPGAWWPTPSDRARPDVELHYVPGRTDLVGAVARPAAPRRPVPDPRGRRPDLPPRRAAWPDLSDAVAGRPGPAVSRVDDLESLAARPGTVGGPRTHPLGSRTTYRVGGTGRPGRGGRRRGRASSRWPGRCAGLDVPVLVLGQRLEPAGGRRRVRRAGGDARPGLRDRSRSTATEVRAGAGAGPAGAGPPDGGRRADRPRVGGGGARDRSGGRCA